MLIGILRDKVSTIATDVDDLLVEIHRLERRIKYDGDGIEVCDSMDDIRSTLTEAVNELADLEIGLNMCLEYGVTELEEVEDGTDDRVNADQ